MAAFADVLTVLHLVVVALLAGALSVLFDVAYPAYIPVVVADTARLTDANGKLFATESAAHVAGPGLGGLLLQALGAAGAIAVDVASFLVSAVTLTMIRSPEPRPSPRRGTARSELIDGLTVPAELLGRTMASIRLFTGGMLPIGALTAGALATAMSPRVALVVFMALLALCPIWLRMSPVGRVRTLAELGAEKARGPRERSERNPH